jgi:hypothetical protein
MAGGVSQGDEVVSSSPVKLPNRLKAMMIAQRSAAQDGQNSPPM